MQEKLTLILCTAGVVALVYLIAIGTCPGKGIIKLAERICAGAALCWLMNLVLSPIGIQIAQSPLAALSAGLLGIPGAAFASLLAGWP